MLHMLAAILSAIVQSRVPMSEIMDCILGSPCHRHEKVTMTATVGMSFMKVAPVQPAADLCIVRFEVGAQRQCTLCRRLHNFNWQAAPHLRLSQRLQHDSHTTLLSQSFKCAAF